MWTCPKCKREFKNRNQDHSCGEFSIEKTFKKFPSFIFNLYRRIHNEVVTFGSVKVYPVKNGIMYSVNSTFLALKPHHSYLTVEFVSTVKHDEFPIEKSVSISKTKYINILKIDSPEAIDGQLLTWLNEAYITNCS